MKSRANLTRIYFGIQEPIDNTACLEFQQQSNDDMKSLGGAAMFNNFFTNRTSSNKNLDSKNTANAPRINFDPKGAASGLTPPQASRSSNSLGDSLGVDTKSTRAHSPITRMSGYWTQGHYDASPKKNAQQQLNILYAPQVGPIGEK